MEETLSSWQEAICALPDKQFFSIMRLYLGEIKTPYNKQRLTEQLASFLKNKEISTSLVSLLDATDIQFLSAISIIPNATQEILIDFFTGSFSMSEVYSTIVNLSERLLIYKNPAGGRQQLLINPFLKDVLSPYLNPKILFPRHEVIFHNTDDVFTLSPDFLAAFFSYIRQQGIGCKADGKIKKSDMTRLSAIFNGRMELIQLITDALINLSLLREGNRCWQLDSGTIKAFAALDADKQYALLCAASVSRFSRDGLRKEAQLLLDCLASVPQEGLSRNELLRLAFLARSRSADGSAVARKSRFSMILEAAREREKQGGENANALQSAQLLDRMLDSAIQMGLLQKTGTDKDGTEIFKAMDFSNSHSQGTRPKILNIDSIFAVTIMPGLPLSGLLPLTSFMAIKKSGIATEYEITRQSVSTAFDEGKTPEALFELMEAYLPYKIPENLKINIIEWHNSYSSARLYRGFVLKTNESNSSLVENNPHIKNMIAQRLAPGIYLLNLPLDASEADIHHFIVSSGMEFLGQVHQPTRTESSLAFPAIQTGRAICLEGNDGYSGGTGSGRCEGGASDGAQLPPQQEYGSPDILKAEQFLASLRHSLEEKALDKNQKESLEQRIKRRLILSEKQLSVAAVRTEILEADGMDFSGKLHLLEAAAKEGDLTEIQLPNADGSTGTFPLIGIPLSLSKQPGEAVMRFQIQPANQIETFLVSRISHVRRLGGGW